ncbi:MAG: penicillin-binding protein 1B [Gammaproteobacteria bacterium]|nr:penicillin-binding protein 1B [Gammaproteobacteria bacterium]
MARRKLKPALRRKLQRGFAILALLGLLAVIVLVAVLDRRVTQQFEGRRWTLPARVYAQPLELYVGQDLSSVRFAEALTRLGYIQRTPVDRPGTYRRKGETVEVYVREFRFSDDKQAAQKLKLSFDGDVVTALTNASGTDVPVYRLDPVLIGSIFPIHGEDRIIVSPAEVPALLPEALKAVEDRKFDTHHGVNPLAILRALFVNVRAGQVEQGGSTLTQQLVKSYFLDSRRTIRRKVEEAIMAFILESRFEKADIMNAYINEIYLGQDGRRAVHGFGLASQFYFGKPLSELNLPEIALMVAIVRGPSYYDPRRHQERVLERRNLVLKVLAEQGVVKPAEAERAMKAPLGITDTAHRSANYFPAFLDLVRRQLREDYPEQALTETGLTVFSTLDPLLQEKAEDALSDELERQDKGSRKAARGLEGSVVVTTPQTGEVVAIVGGRRASFDGFNRALDMKRPIGSLAKPMVYLAALQSGSYTPASVVMDEPVELKLENGDLWKPNNYDRKIHGQVTLLRALTQSYNLATVNLGMDVGLGAIAKTYVQLGLDEAPPKYPSIMLGTAQLNPVEVAQMYNTLANGGFRSPLRAVRAVIDEHGKALKAPELEVTEAAPAEAVYTLDRMLIEVFERGTARPAKRSLPPNLVVAGKTGTSNDYRDSWFAGFSGGHLIVVWMGHDDNAPTGLTGTTGALQAWTRLMSSITTTSFEPLMPEEVEDRWIEYYSGLETSPYCSGSAVSMPFEVGTVLNPSLSCPPGITPEEGALMQPLPPDVPTEDGVAVPPAATEPSANLP